MNLAQIENERKPTETHLSKLPIINSVFNSLSKYAKAVW